MSNLEQKIGKMNRAEAEVLVAETKTLIASGNESYVKAAHNVVAFRDHCGWEALGHKSFAAAVEPVFGISRPRAYQLIDMIHTLEVLDSDPELSTTVDNFEEKTASTTERVLRHLAKVPDAEKAPVLKKAVAAAKAEGRSKPTSTDVKKAVEESKQPEVKPEPQTPLEKAMARIKLVCQHNSYVAISTGIVKLTPEETILFASQPLEIIEAVEELVVGKRLRVKSAIKLVTGRPDGDTTADELMNLAISKGGVWTGQIGPFHFKVSRTPIR